MKNHTATHLLQSALIAILGKTVKQSGSLVHPDYLRFDFTYHENISPENIKKIEDLVNAKIRENIPVLIEYTTMREAVKQGALAFFGDKYNPENVRMVAVNHFSVELCGGTHVPTTGAIGAFKITESTALSSGHRRIVAVTGPGAIDLFQETFTIVKNLSQEFKVKRENVVESTLKLKNHNKELLSEVRMLKKQIWHTQLETYKKQITTINTMPFLYVALNNVSNEDLREMATELSQQQPGFYFLLSSIDNRCIFLANLSGEFLNKLDLKQFATWLKDKHDLHGGSTKNSVRGGGEKFEAHLGDRIKGWLEKHSN
jgi:alanyl-tRNA synthetase